MKRRYSWALGCKLNFLRDFLYAWKGEWLNYLTLQNKLSLLSFPRIQSNIVLAALYWASRPPVWTFLFSLVGGRLWFHSQLYADISLKSPFPFHFLFSFSSSIYFKVYNLADFCTRENVEVRIRKHMLTQGPRIIERKSKNWNDSAHSLLLCTFWWPGQWYPRPWFIVPGQSVL